MNSNQLSREQSPYLLQHKDNPVHWMPWGPEAFTRAAAEDKPILLSIGYAACHWCHVMAHESFEDPEIAALMNRGFINVKVDREERPDVDKIYMDALHRLGEQGGWPLTMFLKPDGSPFWGGTYFPPTSRYGRPSFRHVLTEIARIWREERHKVDLNSAAILNALRAPAKAEGGAGFSQSTLASAARALIDATDMEHGGLRGAPKFPQTAIYDFLWRQYLRTGHPATRDAVIVTLRNICQGGIYDHLAGGFARYSVDHRWLVPHFEKMLYDNALLVSLMSRVIAVEPNDLFRTRIKETVAWMISDMRTQIGTFAASYDADSEGEEGRYYVWSRDEIGAILPGDACSLFCDIYDVSQSGNWEGKNILNRLKTQALLSPDTEHALAECRSLLLAARRKRVPPGFDDKSLADWNGLAIAAVAEAGLLLDRQDWLRAAAEAFASLMAHHRRGAALCHSYRNGELRGGATADGYANLIAAALNLYSATAEADYLRRARDLASAAMADLWDETHGGFFFAPRQEPELIVRLRYAHDDATPNGNATMLSNCIRLHHLTGEKDDRRRADALLEAFGAQAGGNPFAYASFLAAVDQDFEPLQAVIVGDSRSHAAPALRAAVLHLPAVQPIIQYVSAGSRLPAGHPAHGKEMKEDRPTLYLCRGTRCAAPVTAEEEVEAAFRNLS
ncbi:MAG TPA: thioredoxin domain-containing protein [Aestuariivirgaceae bacterium]|jgi:uncharacterized protein YyaL (SSP411 family)